MKKYTLQELKPELNSIILFKSKSDGLILISKWRGNSYLIGKHPDNIENDYKLEDVEWWCYVN